MKIPAVTVITKPLDISHKDRFHSGDVAHISVANSGPQSANALQIRGAATHFTLL
jgi:hypothetical protein